MAEQVFRWVKSPHHRIFSSNSQVIQTSDFGDGTKVTIRFANLWTDVEKESFPAEPVAGGVTVKGPAVYSMGQFYRIEESAVQMTPINAAALIEALLTQAKAFPDDAKAKVKAAVEKF
jgi:hypothetical protein